MLSFLLAAVVPVVEVVSIEVVDPCHSIYVIELGPLNDDQISVYQIDESLDDVVFFSKNIEEDLLPVFTVSCVTGQNLNYLTKFLNVLPVQSQTPNGESEEASTAEFLIHTKFVLGDQIILAGSVTKGKIKKRQIMYIGPDEAGEFRKVEISSIHCYKVAVASASCGQTCSVGVKFGKLASEWLSKTTIRKGMVLVENRKKSPRAVYEFKAEITPFGMGQEKVELPPFYEPTVTSFTFRRTCVLVGESSDIAISMRKEMKEHSLSPDRVTLAEKDPKLSHSERQEPQKPRLMSSSDCLSMIKSFGNPSKPAKEEEAPPTPVFVKYRSRSKDDAVTIKSEETEGISAKRIKYPQECLIDNLLIKKQKPVSPKILQAQT